MLPCNVLADWVTYFKRSADNFFSLPTGRIEKKINKINFCAMHCNQDIQDLEVRLDFQKSSHLSQNERLTFLFDKQTESTSTSSSTSTLWPKSLSSSNR